MTGNELIEFGVGSVLAFVAAAMLVFAVTGGRTRRAAFGWFGAFTAVYAIRLLARVVPLDRAVGVSAGLTDFVGPAITYLILTPLAAAAAEILDRRSRLLARLWQADLVYGALATVTDVARGNPGSMLALNAPAVVCNLAIVLAVLVRTVRHTRRTPGLVAALVGLGLFIVPAGYETYAGAVNMRVPVSLEPFGMLAFIAGLGYLIGEQVVAAERRMLALSQEMETARRIQQSILPDGVPDVPGLAIEARLLPMSAVAGDFFDFVRLPGGAVGVLVADVSGHGVPAAIIASMVKIAFASETEHARDPGALLARVNQTLCGKFEQAYVSAVYACVDPVSGTLAYASAGHPPPIVRRAAGEILRLEERDLVLGFAPGVRYSTGRVDLRAGDLVLFYTDGVTEVEGPGGHFFGDRQFEWWFGRVDAATPPVDVVDALLGEMNGWKVAPRGEFADDVTVIAVRSAR